MVDILWRNPEILALALGKEKVWIRAREYLLDVQTNEKADLVFQDACIGVVVPEITCYVLELKSDIGDHEILGQLQKATEIMKRIASNCKHWEFVEGIAVSKRYTKSGLQLLNDNGFRAFVWNENENKVYLTEVGNVIVRKAIKFKKEKVDDNGSDSTR